MDRYLKRDSTHSGGGAPAKRRRVLWGKGEPRSVIAWNCNGLSVRLKIKEDKEAFLALVRDHAPDVLCISEIRCAALASKPGAKKNDGSKRNRGKLGPADADAVNTLLRSRELSEYEAYFSLADWRYAGTAVLIRRAAVAKPNMIRYSLKADAESHEHDNDGRVIFAAWPSLAILHTYSPNNGWTMDSFPRREKWDVTVKAFLKKLKDEGKTVLWCGDLNVAPLDMDLSHPAHYKRQKLTSKPNGSRLPPASEDYVGQPGCTPAERRRFAQVLDESDMVDLYRLANSEPDVDDILGARFSWRGGAGKHHGRGMRIDHFIGSRVLAQRVQSAEILGRGSERIGFLGSDHCPIKLVLTDSSGLDAEETERELEVHEEKSSA